MSALSQEQINVDLFDEVKRLKLGLAMEKDAKEEYMDYAEKLEKIIEDNLGSVEDYIAE